jgi:hypothetical protein
MSKRDDVKDFLIGLVFYILSCTFFIWFFEQILTFFWGKIDG